MKCTRCGQENYPGTQFCVRCGNVMPHPAYYQQAAVRQPAYDLQVPEAYRPIGMWGYFGYSLLFSIPIIGFIVALIMALGGAGNINLKNFARAQFCWLIILVIFYLLLAPAIFSVISGLAV